MALAVAIQAVAFLVFFERGIQVGHISQTALPVAVALGKLVVPVAALDLEREWHEVVEGEVARGFAQSTQR